MLDQIKITINTLQNEMYVSVHVVVVSFSPITPEPQHIHDSHRRVSIDVCSKLVVAVDELE